MANLYKANQGLKEKISKLEKLRIIDTIGIFAIFFGFTNLAKVIGDKNTTLAIIIAALGFFGFFFCVKSFFTINKKIEVYSSGLTGEVKTQAILCSLPSEYNVIVNANIEYTGQKSELDSIVVGPTGVFIVETKNYSGIIRGNINDQYLQHVKISGGGNEYTSSFYNPVKQVATHTYRLSGLLKSKGIDKYVHNCVFFSAKDISLQIEETENSPTPIFMMRDHLLNHLTTFQPSLTSEDIDKITKIIINSAS